MTKLAPPLATATATSTRTLLGLELLRFACAVSVLIYHYNHFYAVGADRVGFEVTQQPLYRLLRPVYEAGWLAVQIFWCLSGFIFFWKYATPVAQGRVSAWHFAALRFSRLYPLHLATLLIVAALAAWYRGRQGSEYLYPNNDWPHFALQLLLASDWSGRNEWSFNGPIWSISIEVLVYGLFFLLCRLGLTRWWQVLGLIMAASAVSALKLTAHPIVLCVFFFYLGGFTHLAHVHLIQQPRLLQRALLGLGLLAIGAGAWLVSIGRLRPMLFGALLAPVSMLVLLDWVQPRSARLISLINSLGNTTYASYLLHVPLQLLLANVMWGQGVQLPLRHPAFLLGYLLLTFGLAAVVYRTFELPAQAWLRERLR